MVQFDEEAVWLDAHSIAELFGVNRLVIIKHVGTIYKS